MDKCTLIMEQSCPLNSIENVININNNFIGVIYYSSCEVFDKRNNAKELSEEGNNICIAAFDDGKFVKVNGDRIALLNENLEILREATFEKPYDLIEVMNENTIIVADSAGLHFLNFSNEGIKCYFSIESEDRIDGITKIAMDKFAYFDKHKIQIVNLNGDLIQNLSSPRAHFKSVYKLNDYLLIVECFLYMGYRNSVEIWNISTGDLVKSLPDYYLVGVCSFGFFLRRDDEEKLPFLQAYDMDGQFIGVVPTETISMLPIEKVTYFGNDLYCFAHKKGFKLVECKWHALVTL